MFITERKYGIIKLVNIFFPDAPIMDSIPDFDILTYYSYKNWDSFKGFEKLPTITTKIDLTQGIDRVWTRINNQHRRHIQRAEKRGIKVGVSCNYEEFHKIYKKVLIQKGFAGPFGLNLVTSQFMKKYGILFIAEYQGKILGGNLFYYDEENNVLSAEMAYELTENSIENKKQIYDANCYIHWEAMKYFDNLDVINYYLGGVNHFTQSFGGDIIPQYNYMQFNSPLYRSLFRFGKLFLRTQKWF